MTVPGLSHRRVVIVGAGYAGLEVAGVLRRAGLVPQRDFTVIDANKKGQRSWATRWHSMPLRSDAYDSAVAGRVFPGDQGRHPRAYEMEAYLASVEASLGVAVMWGIRAVDLESRGHGSTLILSTTEGSVQTRNVVCATGSSVRPWAPSWAAELSVPGVVMHSADYRSPQQIPEGDVLIIGSGDSGVQIARELAPSHDVTISSRYGDRRDRQQRQEGSRSWFARRRSRLLKAKEHAELQQHGASIVPAADGADDGHVVLGDGVRMSPRSVIFATGYLPGDDWLPQTLRHSASTRGRRGRTSMPGLLVAGIPGYSRPGADNFAGMRRDATSIARLILNRP